MGLNTNAVLAALMAHDAAMDLDATTAGKMLAMTKALEAYEAAKNPGPALNFCEHLYVEHTVVGRPAGCLRCRFCGDLQPALPS